MISSLRTVTSLRSVLSLIDRSLRRRWIVVAVLGVVVSVLEAVGALLTVVLFASLQPASSKISIPFVGDLTSRMPFDTETGRTVALCVLVAIFFVVRAAVVLFQMHLQYDTAARSGLDVSDRLLRGYMRLPLVDHGRDNSARFIRNVNESSTITAVQAFIPVIALASEATLITGIVIVLLIGAPIATLLAGVLIGTTGAVSMLIVQPKIGRYGRMAQEETRQTLQVLSEIFGGIRDVKVNGSEDLFRDAFMEHRRRYVKGSFAPFTLAAAPRVAVETAVMLALAAVVAWVQADSNVTDLLPVLALFGYASLRLLPAVNRIFNAGTNLRYGLAAVANLRGDLLMFDSSPPPPATNERLSFERSLELDGITFTYPGADRPALDQVSISVPSGSSLGIVGQTGSGKSTLVDVILGLLVPDGGTVQVDGVDLGGVVPQWHQGVGLVPQTIFLLDDTLRRNITFSVRGGEVDEERLEEAVRLAQLDEVVAGLPSGLDTEVGERGARLSGGQRQRVVIARALYRRPALLVFDEGTSALDTATESSLFGALEAVSASQTVVMVAHRLSTVRNCDQVVVLDGGRIAAAGTYAELLVSSELFRQLNSA